MFGIIIRRTSSLTRGSVVVAPDGRARQRSVEPERKFLGARTRSIESQQSKTETFSREHRKVLTKPQESSTFSIQNRSLTPGFHNTSQISQMSETEKSIRTQIHPERTLFKTRTRLDNESPFLSEPDFKGGDSKPTSDSMQPTKVEYCFFFKG